MWRRLRRGRRAPSDWSALLKRSFHTLKADGPFIFERAEVNATATDRLASSGDPPTRLRLRACPVPARRDRYRLEGHLDPPGLARRRRTAVVIGPVSVQGISSVAG